MGSILQRDVISLILPQSFFKLHVKETILTQRRVLRGSPLTLFFDPPLLSVNTAITYISMSNMFLYYIFFLLLHKILHLTKFFLKTYFGLNVCVILYMYVLAKIPYILKRIHYLLIT